VALLLPERRVAPRRVRRAATLAVLLGAALVLGGCSSDTEAGRLAMPSPVTEEGEHTLALWQGAWIAALATGLVVWGLIFWVVVRYRRRHDDEVPVQTRYNLPLEIFYTIFPIVMVIVFFDHTIKTQNAVYDPDAEAQNTVYVVGQQWSWTFNYPDETVTDENGQEVEVNIYESGTGNDIPELYLPVDETTRFELRTPDVIHDFGVPGFLIKMDVMPAQDNSFAVTPKVTGEYAGKCYELCGVYHSRMLFNVQIVDEQEFQDYLQSQYDAGFYSEEPVCGGSYTTTQVGLDESNGQVCGSNESEDMQ
jgi:cytochrome c oxidase subunit II